MSDFKPGDVVVLKSGGPPMTVSKIGTSMQGETYVSCVWFEKMDKKGGSFQTETLIKEKDMSK